MAVLAHGLHTIYPATNKKLALEIVDNGGCLFTEYPYGQDALRKFFVARDRLQSGLSYATIVIETDIKGGTMHTVDFTLKQGRKLYAIQHPEYHRNVKSQGNEFLVFNGKAIGLADSSDFEFMLGEVQQAYNKDHLINVEIIKDMNIVNQYIQLNLGIEDILKGSK